MQHPAAHAAGPVPRIPSVGEPAYRFQALPRECRSTGVLHLVEVHTWHSWHTAHGNACFRPPQWYAAATHDQS